MITEKKRKEKKKKMLLEAPEVSLEQQRAFVHKRLLNVADEIFEVLENLVVEEEEVECQIQPLDITLKIEERPRSTDISFNKLPGDVSSFRQKKSDQLSTDPDCESVHGKTSHPHQTQTSERASAVMDSETLPPSGQEVLSSNSSGAESEADESDSDKSKTFQKQNKCLDRYKTRDEKKTTTVSEKNKSQSSSCRVCGKFFHYKRSFLKHVLQHGLSSHLCGACGKHLGLDESLEDHLQSHNEESIGSDADSNEDCRDNDRAESDEKELSKTKTQGSDITEVPKHKDASHLKYRCKVCGKPFCYRASFLKHVQEDEKDADVCGVCGKRFESEDVLRLHLQTYVRTNDCEVCGKRFDGHKQLEMHRRTHTGEKPYICAVCGKAFTQNGNLMGHMRVHTGERPYACSICGQSFGFKEYMMAHMRIHTGEKPFLCSVCGKGFRQRGTLKTHMMIHTGESSHVCSVCDKKFYKSGALKIHMRSHTGEKPYLCNVCGKSFTASGSLTKHMGVHEAERTQGKTQDSAQLTSL
ncbi:uncharacterized protein V6R79_005058 [Siganus canaliculatus]